MRDSAIVTQALRSNLRDEGYEFQAYFDTGDPNAARRTTLKKFQQAHPLCADCRERVTGWVRPIAADRIDACMMQLCATNTYCGKPATHEIR